MAIQLNGEQSPETHIGIGMGRLGVNPWVLEEEKADGDDGNLGEGVPDPGYHNKQGGCGAAGYFGGLWEIWEGWPMMMWRQNWGPGVKVSMWCKEYGIIFHFWWYFQPSSKYTFYLTMRWYES